jgi:predicted hydrocarbon binding protein
MPDVRSTGFRERLQLDEAQGEYRDGAIRYLLMRPDVLMGAFADLPEAARDLALDALGRAALRFGGRSVQAYREAGAHDPTALLDVISQTSPQLGWGRWRFAYEEDRRTLKLTVRNSPFAAGYGRSPVPVCHAVRGIFTALAPVVLGDAVSVEETCCVSRDGGDHCHFVMRSI